MLRKILNHVKEFRSGYVLAISSILFISYSTFIFSRSDLSWSDTDSIKDYIHDVSPSIPVALMIAGTIIGGFDIMKLFSDVYEAKQKKKIEEAIKANRYKDKDQILKILKEKGVNGSISIDELEKILNQVIEDVESL